MTATLSPDRADDARPMILVTVPDGTGGMRHEWRPKPEEKPKGRKPRRQPDPIEANPDNAAQSLRLLIERREQLEEEKAGLADDIKDVNAEAKALGFSVKTITRIIAMRKQDPHVLQEDEALLETYKTALGIE